MKTSKLKSLSNSKKNSSVKKTTRAKPNYVEPLVTDTLKDIIMRQSNTTKKVGKVKIGLHAISTDSKSTKRLSIKKQNRIHQTGRTSTKKQNRVLLNVQPIFEPSKTWNPQQIVNSSKKKQKISLYQQANKSLSRVEQICEQATNSILKTKRKSDASILQQANLMYEMLNKKLNDLQQNQMKFQQNNNTRMQKYEREKNQQLNFLKQETVTLKSFLDEGMRKNQILQKKYCSLEKNLESVRFELGNKENIIRELTQSNKKLRESNFSVTSKLPAYQQQIKQLEDNLTGLNMKRNQLEESILRNQKQKAFIKEQSKFILKNLREYQNEQEIQIPDMTQQSQSENISPKNKV